MSDRDQHYHVVYRGKIAKGSDRASVRAAVIRLLKLNPAKADRIFSGKPMTIKKNVPRSEAVRIVGVFKKLGAVCDVVAVKPDARSGFNVTNGTFGVRIRIPDQWHIVEQSETRLTWELSGLERVEIEFLPHPVVILPPTLDDFRQDLRLLATLNHGGLVECEILENFGVSGITKAPQETGGVTYTGYVLLPATGGHISITVVAKEGSPTGLRDTTVALATGGVDTGDGWFFDPYGIDLEPEGSLFSRLFRKQPPPVAARNQSDDSEYDAEFPKHPLSRVRKVLAEIRANTQEVDLEEMPGNARIDSKKGFYYWLPLAFRAFDDGKMKDGQVYKRATFGGGVSLVSVCLQPDFPGCGEDLSEAKRLVQTHAKWSGGSFIRNPIFKKRKMEGMEGIYSERELAQADCNILSRSFFIPWFDSSIEITVTSELADGSRAVQWLAFVVRSLNSTESA